MPIRLVLADDHPLILDGIEQLVRLQDDLEVVDRCVSGEEAVRAVEQHQPDVLVLDIRMPRMSGLAVVAALRELGSPTRVVLLAAAIQEDEMVEAVRLGVAGVVLKEMAPRMLLQCIRKVAAGERWVENKATHDALERVLRREAGAREAAAVLTPREVELVRMVAHGLRNREIATTLHITEGTVKAHLHNVYKKLKVETRIAVRRYAEEKGLL